MSSERDQPQHPDELDATAVPPEVFNDTEELDAAAPNVEFAVFPSVIDASKVGRILSVRLELVDLFTISSDRLHVLAGSPDDAPEEGIISVVIERQNLSDPSTTHKHMYSATGTLPAEFLEEGHHAENNPKLAEDAQVLQFTAVMNAAASAGATTGSSLSTGAGGGAGIRTLMHRKIKPLANENQMMRQALQIGKTTRVTPTVLNKSITRIGQRYVSAHEQQRSQHQHHGGDMTHHGGGGGAEAAEFISPIRQQHPAAGAGGSAPGSRGASQSPPKRVQRSAGGGETAGPLHSPLLWEQETEAARNARTPYSAFKPRSQSAKRKLDAVTQGHLVARLHDKSVDEKSKRLAEYEERTARELGLHERRVLSTDEQYELATRLHDKCREQKRESMNKLNGMYLCDMAPKGHLSKAQQDNSNQRIYYSVMEKTKEDMAKLVQTYVLDKEPPKVKLSRGQQQQMADRLSSPNRRL